MNSANEIPVTKKDREFKVGRFMKERYLIFY